MKILKFKMAPLACAMLLSGSVFAEADNEMRISKIESQLRDSATTNARGTYGAKLADASPNIDGYGFYVSADVILFQMLQDSNEYGVLVNAPSAGVDPWGTYGPTKVLKTSFDWDWGFRTGIGYYAEHDFWQSGFEFTYFQTQTSGNTQAGTNQFLGYFCDYSPEYIYGDSVAATYASDSWKVHFYNLDWKIGKDFFVSKYLSFLPEIGLKATWLYQNRYYKNSVPATRFGSSYTQQYSNVSDHYTGVGPKADITTKLWLGRHFSLIGTVDAALLFGSNKMDVDQLFYWQYQGTVSNPNTSHQKKNHVSPYLGVRIGFAYDTNFMDDAFNLGIKLTYEQQWYSNANRMPFFQEKAASNDVSFQGVDLGFTFSF